MHEVHEGAGCVGETEGQHEELEVTVACAERGLGHVLWVDANLVVAAAQVDLAEVLRALQTVEQFVDTRQRVAVLDGDVVQRTIVDAHAHGAILLLHEQDGCTEWRLARLNEASLGQFLELLLQFGQLGGTQTEGGSAWRGRTGNELDTMVHLARWRQSRWQLLREHIAVGRQHRGAKRGGRGGRSRSHGERETGITHTMPLRKKPMNAGHIVRCWELRRAS